MNKIAFSAIIILLLVTLSCDGDAHQNDLNLAAFENSFLHLDHPANTEKISFRKAVGLLVGNGNHCDYFVGEIRSYDGDKNAVLASYQNAKVKNAVTQADDSLEIVFIDNGEIPNVWLPSSYEQLDNWQVTQDTINKPLYLIYIFRSYEANGDWRCH